MNKKLTVLACATLLIMSGCAKKAEESAEMAASDASAEVAAGAASPESPAVQNATNPEQLVSDQQSALEQSRQLVKSAQLSFEVNDIQKTTQELEKQLIQVNGYVESKNVDYRVEDYKARSKLDGTVDVFEKIMPTAQLTIRVPNQQVTTFLNGLLPLMKNFNQQSYEAKRYELKLLEEKISNTQQISGTASAANNALNSQVQRLTQLEVQDRLQYSTISIQYYQTPQLRQRQDLNLQRVANLHSDPFFARIWQSIKMGLIGFREVIIWLVMIWPAYLIIGVIIIALRFRRNARNKID